MIYFNLLKNYFEHNRLEFNGDYRETVEKFNLQSLSPFLYYVYGNQFFNIYLAALKIQERFFRIEKELDELFKKQTVPHFYIKGTVLSKLYDDSVLRTRGDIDLVIKEEDKNIVKELLINNGYIYEDECFHHMGFVKEKLHVEVHTKMLSQDHKLRDDFEDCFKHTSLIKDYLYRLDDTYHYLFCLMHFNRHLKNGEGLRYLLDFYYMQLKFNINYPLLEKLINKYKLNRLHENIINSVYLITNVKLFGFSNENSFFFIEFLERSGIHSKNVNVLSVEVSRSKSKTYYIFDKLFLFDKNVRKNLYPRLSTHIIYYPILLIHRFFRLLFRQFKTFFKVLKVKTLKKNKIDDIYSKLGVVEL